MYISKRIMVIGLFLILALSATGLVLAQADGVISACVNPAGSVRIVEDSSSCLPKETLLQWNIQGEKGDKGDKGDQGEVGPMGPQGPAGVLGFYVVEGTHQTCVPRELCYLDAYCDEGDYLTGGGLRKAGYYILDDPGLGVIAMEPYFDPVEERWDYQAVVSNQHVADHDFWTYAICAQMP